MRISLRDQTGKVGNMKPELRLRFHLTKLTLLNTIIAHGTKLYEDINSMKRSRAVRGSASEERMRKVQRKPEEKLRNRAPWG